MRQFLHVEGLESRRLLSVTISAPGTPVTVRSGILNKPATTIDLTNGTLTLYQPSDLATITSKGTLVVHGTDLGETISISRQGSLIRVWRGMKGNEHNALDFTYPASAVKRILVEAGAGNDRVGLDGGVGEKATIAGGAGNDLLQGNVGDTLIGGSGDDTLYIPTPAITAIDVALIKGPVTVRSADPSLLSGGAGDDTLITSNSPDSVIGGSGSDLFVALAPIVIKLNGSTNTAEGIGALSGVETIKNGELFMYTSGGVGE